MMPDKVIRSFDGVKIAYRLDKKDSEKPMLVFIHGIGGNSSAWDDIIGIFEKQGFSTLKIDLRGHGMSEKPSKRKLYSVENMVKDIDFILEKESIKDAVFICHSFGGSVVLKYSMTRDNKVSRMVLCNSPHTMPFRYCPNKLVKRFHWMLRPLIWAVASLSFIRKARYDYPLYCELKELSEYELFRKDLSGAPLRNFLWNYLLMFSFNLDIDNLSAKTTPALLISSDKDNFLLPESMIELSKILKNSRLVTIDDCDHETIIRKPEEVSRHILGFLR